MGVNPNVIEEDDHFSFNILRLSFKEVFYVETDKSARETIKKLFPDAKVFRCMDSFLSSGLSDWQNRSMLD